MKNVVLKAQVVVINALGSLVDRFPKACSNVAYLAPLSAGLMMLDATTNAAIASGLGGWSADFKTQTLVPLVEFVKWCFYGGGVVSTGVGIGKLIQTSKPNSQVTPMEAGGYILGGGGLMGVGYISQLAQESMTVGNSSSGF